MRKKKCLCIYVACGLFFLCILIISFSVDAQAAIDSLQAYVDISIDEDLDTDYFPEPYGVTHDAITNANDTTNTHLPIDITAIGRTEHTDITLSIRFFDLDLFSINSRRINEAMAEQIRLSREALGSELFESFEIVRAVDINEQVAIAATSMGLFTEPVSFGRVGQVDTGDEIPLWVFAAMLPICAILGFVIARAVVSKKKS